MLASFSMAFYRANINLPLLVNNVYYKFSINACKIHPSKRQLTTKSKQPSSKRARFGNQLKEKDKKFYNLSDYIAARKAEARRSIIIQIASWKSCKELVHYCSQFGEIANIYYYLLPKDHQFILLEYRNKSSAESALNAATYVDKENIVPSRTNVMWFRKVSENTESSQLNPQNLPPINSCNYMSVKESIVRNSIVNATSLSSQMMILYNEYKIQEIEIRLKFQIIANLEWYFSGIFPSIIVHPFGSFINGFGRKLSDLDVVLFADGFEKENTCSKLVFHTKATNVNEKQQTHEFMGVLADTMRYMIPGISHVRRIFNARVPIIKFNNIFTHTECDLSINNVIATYMSELLYLYGELDDRVRPLVFTIRKWAYDNKLTSLHPGKTITNFSLTLLVIFYLQQQKILPVINNMEGFAEINERSYYLDQIYLHQIKQHWILRKNNDYLSNLLLDFFRFYSTFNFQVNEICLREGRTFEKRDNSALYIHNPFEKGLNVSKNVSANEVERMKSLMVIAISNLKNTMSSKSKNWGILSIFNIPGSQSSSIDASQILSKENKTKKEVMVMSENDGTTETIQKSDISNTLNTKSSEIDIKKDVLEQV